MFLSILFIVFFLFLSFILKSIEYFLFDFIKVTTRSNLLPETFIEVVDLRDVLVEKTLYLDTYINIQKKTHNCKIASLRINKKKNIKYYKIYKRKM